jgi:hypothetical protein
MPQKSASRGAFLFPFLAAKVLVTGKKLEAMRLDCYTGIRVFWSQVQP